MGNTIIKDLEKLTEVATEVDDFTKVQETVDILKNKLTKYNNLTFLTAPQVGIDQRIICLNFKDKGVTSFINPLIVQAKDYHPVIENDNPYSDKTFLTFRPNEISVSFQNKRGFPQKVILKGTAAEIFDKANLFLDGIVPSTLSLEVDKDFFNATKEEQNQIIEMYKNSLLNINKEVQDIVEQDKDAKELMEAIKYTTEARLGHIDFAEEDGIDKTKTA